MGEENALGGGGDPPSISGLPSEWQTLIWALYESDGKSIVGFLPKIVALIKATKNAAMAERGLLTVLHSPKVQSKKMLLQEPAELTPGYQALKIYCDAAELPPGKIRATAIAIINAISEEVALSERQIMALIDAVPKTKSHLKKLESAEARFGALLDLLPEDGPDEAATQRAKRARRTLGNPRKRGRPKKNGQE